VADVICDLVSSGATLYENGLKEILNVSQSQALLVRAKGDLSPEKSDLIDRLVLRIKGVQKAAKSKYIMLHIDRSKLDRLQVILPGSETPTTLELKGSPDKVAVHVVSHEDVFWETVEKLKKIGATSILVLPIEKMIA
jgi:ATP phosphoribosyltransferase